MKRFLVLTAAAAVAVAIVAVMLLGTSLTRTGPQDVAHAQPPGPGVCDLTDLGMAADPSGAVMMEVGTYTSVDITETIVNAGGVPPAICLASIIWGVVDVSAGPPGVPIDPAKLNVRLEARNCAPAPTNLTGDVCYIGNIQGVQGDCDPLTDGWCAVTCDEQDMSPYYVCQYQDSCENGLDDTEPANDMADWAGYAAAIPMPADPNCIDVQGLILQALNPPVMVPGTPQSFTRTLKITCNQAGQYALYVWGMDRLGQDADQELLPCFDPYTGLPFPEGCVNPDANDMSSVVVPVVCTEPPAEELLTFAVDADPWGGGAGDYPCKDIDAENTVNVGDDHMVAVCVVNTPEKEEGVLDNISAFGFTLTYHDNLNECKQPDPSCPGQPCLDDNPDANTGSTLGAGHVPTTVNLGGGWGCPGLGSYQPTCSGGQAVISCMSYDGPWTSGGLEPFPLAVVEFTAKNPGTDTMDTTSDVWGGKVLGDMPVEAQISADVIKEPQPPTPTPTATATFTPVPPTPTFTPLPEGVRMEKTPKLANLWIMADGCTVPEEGKGCLVIEKWVYAACDADSPNDLNTVAEGVGAWEEQIKYDHKIVRLTPEPVNTWLSHGTLRDVDCSMTILTENWILTGCVSSGTADGPGVVCDDPMYGEDGLIETITVVPVTDDLIYRQGFRPGKDNGVVTDIVDENCEVADTLGEQLPGTLPGGLTMTCGDAAITVRMLEGDVNLDCVVDVFDEQGIAFRYGTFFGLQLYDEWFDLAPECIQDEEGVIRCYAVPDFDIDIKDLQFVFGRDGSTCQRPIPDDQANPVEPPQP